MKVFWALIHFLRGTLVENAENKATGGHPAPYPGFATPTDKEKRVNDTLTVYVILAIVLWLLIWVVSLTQSK